ncbi:Hsp70 family protein [bacterium]|nr:Hsp70 family protein [bacterium]
MYDVAEAAKIQVSQMDRTPLHFDGKGFRVRDTLTRSEFERIIRTDSQAIAERLDSVIAASGLKPHQIDRVIRTGGSSEIPTFITMLAERFGADKVQALDIFGSVTAGLGFVAHEVIEGKSPLKAYHRDALPTMPRVSQDFPLVDLDQLTRLIDLKETRSHTSTQASVLVMRDSEQFVHALAYDWDAPPVLPHPTDEVTAFVPAEERLILLTTESRTVTRSARQLAELSAIGVKLEAIEDFKGNEFGRETVCAMIPPG